MSSALQARVGRFQFAMLVLGILALALTGYGAVVSRRQFFFSYLFACLFWLGLSLGCFTVTMIHQLTGGRWGYPTRRFFEAGFSALPLMFILFIPLFFGLDQLYPWARPADRAAESVLAHRHPYENAWAFMTRAVVFLLIWMVIGWFLRRWSLDQDATPDAAPTRKARALSGPGLVIYGLLGSFAYVDWIMSLEIRWYSTLFPVVVMGGQVLAAFAFGIIMASLFRHEPSLAAISTKRHFHQLGNLLLTFVLFWAYVSFGQLLIIYSGDLPPELEWYLHRIAGNWKWIVAALALFHFFLPFFLLLFRSVKWHVPILASLAALLFVMHLVDVYWMVMPSFHRTGPQFSWLDVSAPVGIGAIWLAFVLWRLKAAALVPQQDPGLQFSFHYGH
jgi:hypothetical protein